MMYKHFNICLKAPRGVCIQIETEYKQTQWSFCLSSLEEKGSAIGDDESLILFSPCRPTIISLAFALYGSSRNEMNAAMLNHLKRAAIYS